MPVTERQPIIMLWNAQSITSKSKQLQLENMLNTEHIDIILITETFLKPQHTYQIRNFNIYRNDRLTHAHGGVAIAIRNNIAHKICSPANTSHIENMSIEVKINNIPTRIIVAYSPKFSIHFMNDIQKLTAINAQYMIFGDFNAKHQSWNCNSINKAGNALFDMQQASNFVIHYPHEHTHFPHSGQSPSTIDLAIANVNFTFDLFTHIDQMSSDHAPVICNVLGTSTVTSRKIFDYSKADWKKYRQIIESRLVNAPIPATEAEVNSAIKSFTEIIISARSSAVPIKNQRTKTKISTETLSMIQHKNRLKRLWQRAGTWTEKQQIKCELNRMQKLINKMVKDDYNAHFEQQLSKLEKGDKLVWKLAKQLRGNQDESANNIKIDGLDSIDDYDRAECLSKIFAKAHKITSDYTHENDTTVRNKINSYNAQLFFNCEAPYIEVNEVKTIIKAMKPFKSPGPDSIQNIIVKKLPHAAIVWFTDILNVCLKRSYWPSAFKIAKIIPIPKAGKPSTDPHSYRPISLLNAMGKILEKIIQERLTTQIDQKHLLPEYQFGFRKGHSTVHQAIRIKKFILNNKHNKRSTGMLLLDIEKAFDTVWHDGLISKLIDMKLPIYMVRMINAFIRNRSFAVHINHAISSEKNIPVGLAQGTCLSPILYALYIADLPTRLDTELALYADDTAVLSAAKSANTIVKRLNESLRSIQCFLRKWRIKINTKKTQAILFTFDNKKKRTPTKQLMHDNHKIELHKTVCYLGITFDKKLSFKEHITNAINKTNRCFRAIYPLIAPKSHLSSENKQLIYTSIIRPILAYGSPVWVSAARTHKHKCNVMQNKILKTIHKLRMRTPSSYITQTTQIQPFDKFTEVSNTNFIRNCNASEYNLIREINCL